MRNVVFIVALLGSLLFLVASTATALPTTGIFSLKSPDNRFEATLSDDLDHHSSDWRSPYWLTITDRGRQIARYRFDGELVNGYWSPSEKYLALNNHNGHCGWYVWIISLRTGAVSRTIGANHSPEYDRYLDENELPDVEKPAQNILKKLNPGVEKDGMRLRYISVTYGWETDNRLLMFHEFVYDKLYEREENVIWLRSTFKISAKGIEVKNLQGQKVSRRKEYPPAIRAVLVWITS